MNNYKEIKSINLGIELLRFLLCLWIVFIHCSIIKSNHKKYLKKEFHVPTFMLISFYFYSGLLHMRIKEKIIARFQRLLIPYILWPIIIFLINNFLFKIFSQGICDIFLSIKDFYIQILIGARFHIILWFQFNLIFLSLYFTILSFILRNNLHYILKIFGVLSFYLHISGKIINFFSYYKLNFIKNIGSLFELMPIAVLGVILGSRNLLALVKSYSFSFYFLILFIIYILFEYDIFIYQKGFRYGNILLNMIASANLFMLFGSLPINNYGKSGKIIGNITKFTGGIYYLHNIIRRILNKFSDKKTYFLSIKIYIICYIICFIGNKVFKNTKLK